MDPPSFSRVFNTKRYIKDERTILNIKKHSLIVCFDEVFGFSKNGSIPWQIKADTDMFLDVTKKGKNVVIMGRSTWYSLPNKSRGLPDRINMIISKTMTNDDLLASNLTKSESYIFPNISDAIKSANKMAIDNIIFIGGYEIYKEALHICHLDEIYLNVIDGNFNCDKFFPWQELSNILGLYEIDRDKTFNSVRFIKLVLYRKSTVEEFSYLRLLEDVYRNGEYRQTRNACTYSLFGKTLEFDLQHGFPLLTTKNVSLYNIFHELMFFIKGETNTKLLKDLNVNIWNANTSREFLDSVGLNSYQEGDIGPMYGFNWRHFGADYQGCELSYEGLDQLANCINLIKTDPHSRRIIMTSFNPGQADKGCLYPCHGISIQFYVEQSNHLCCMMTQRSGDLFLGVPYNIASYTLLVHMICEIVPNLIPGRLIIALGDVHIYESHQNQVIRQLLREPMSFPTLQFKRKVDNIEDFKFEDLELINYTPYPNIIAKMVA
jgi:dihydrofolate reductase/thymidylate synthase